MTSDDPNRALRGKQRLATTNLSDVTVKVWADSDNEVDIDVAAYDKNSRGLIVAIRLDPGEARRLANAILQKQNLVD
jgi:hypothetical protein